MTKFIYPIFIMICVHCGAFADCVSTTVYSSCKPGYYLDAGDCVRCTSSDGTYGTTVDKNTGDITSCYLPSGTAFSDDTGSGTYDTDCYYSN